MDLSPEPEAQPFSPEAARDAGADELAATTTAGGPADDGDRHSSGPPEPMTGEPIASEDWAWVNKSLCNSDNKLADGAGSIGVYRLVHPGTGETFAVKMVDRSMEHVEKQVHNFRREVDIMNTLRHPNVCRLLGIVSEPTVHLLVMELADGGELFGPVADGGGLDEDSARGYFKQIMSAVNYCHGLKVCHRDLKLENVLLKNTKAGQQVKITDFGMAKDASMGSQPKTAAIGTVAYMAPEVSDPNGATYSGSQCDVWSLGVMLYVCVVCNYPFGHNGKGGNSTRAVIAKARSGEFSFGRKSKTLSPALQQLVRSMLVPDPAKRITMDGIAAHEWLNVGEPYSPTPDTPATVDWAAVPENGTRLASAASSDFLDESESDCEDDIM